MTTLDGYQVYGFFRAGSRRVNAARSYLDRINVFPVPDGDTGTNLSSTLMGTLAHAAPTASAAATLDTLADAALLSARGNSGVIFAQFVTGLSEAIGSAELRPHEFVTGVHHAYRLAMAAVTEPREGTILSVLGGWAASLSKHGQGIGNFLDLIAATREDLRRSLSETTALLPELKANGVVDAGAAGFVEFVEGMHEFLANGAPPERESAGEAVPLDFDSHAGAAELLSPRPGSYRYCTEAIVEKERVDAGQVRAALAAFGDCLIVAGGLKRIKVHVHTDDPAGVMAALGRFGVVDNQKVDDMRLQYADAHDRRSRVAIVTDSSCDLPPELMERHNVHAVPLLIRAGGSEYLDKLTIDAPRLRTFSEGKGAFPRTSQVPARFFSRLYSFLGNNYDGVVAIHLSAAMSGTFAASAKEAAGRGGAVAAFDSKHLSGSLGLIVLRAAEAAEAGASKDDILASLGDWSAKARIFVSVTSLRYMVRGGRVSPLKGFVARLLNLKPIVSVDAAGKSVLFGKAFSERANLRTLVRMAAEVHASAPLRWYAIGHAGAEEKARALAADLERKLGFPPLYITEISAVVALNSGPGAVSVVTMSE